MLRFGAVGAPDVPDHISLWSLRLAICQPLQQYANVRYAQSVQLVPTAYIRYRGTRILPGTNSPLANCEPGQLDWVIVRENSEGEYAGHGGRSHNGYDHEVATGTTSCPFFTCWSVDLMLHRNIYLYSRRCAKDCQIRFSTRPIPTSQEVDICHQIQCSAERDGHVGRGNQRGLP